MSYKTSSAAGTTIGIAPGDPTTFDEAGFSALAYVNIGKIKNAGDFGKKFELISSNYLSQRGTEKRKGTFNAGTMNLEVDIKSDAGQQACEDALESDEDQNFQIKFKTGLTYYVRGQVTGFTKHIGGPNDMLAATLDVELNPFFADDVELAAIRVLPVATP